jgi:hypothetical protein
MRRLSPLAILLLAAACQTGSKAPAKGGASKPVFSAAAQQRAYDRGVAAFSEERYEDARRSWQEAVRMSPGTTTGRKAQENLSKVDTILRNLKALEGGR